MSRDSYHQQPAVGRKPHIKADDEDMENQLLMFNVALPSSGQLFLELFARWYGQRSVPNAVLKKLSLGGDVEVVLI